MIQQHRVEARPFHLVGAVQSGNEAFAENDFFHARPVRAVKLRPKLRHKTRSLNLRPGPGLAQHAVSRRQQRLANVETRKRALLHHQRPHPALPCRGRRTTARRATANHEQVKFE